MTKNRTSSGFFMPVFHQGGTETAKIIQKNIANSLIIFCSTYNQRVERKNLFKIIAVPPFHLFP